MIVVDTSAWVELFRGTESPAHLALERLVRARAELMVTEVVVMELLAGTQGASATREVRRRLAGVPVLPLKGLPDYETAAALYRACRRGGETVRSLTDCLIAVVVIAAGATLLGADRDFEVLARHTPLRLEPLAA